MSIRIVAAGQDGFWLAAVQKAMEGWSDDFSIVKCPGDFLNCIGKFQPPETQSVLLVDASSQSHLKEVVTVLRDQGWKYVVVVAADPSAKVATTILRGNLGFDYWEKTYDEEVIRNRIIECINEITTELPPITPEINQSKK